MLPAMMAATMNSTSIVGMHFDKRADAAKHRKQPKHRARIGDGQEKRLRNIPGEILETCIGTIDSVDTRMPGCVTYSFKPKAISAKSADDLNDGAVRLHGPR